MLLLLLAWLAILLKTVMSLFIRNTQINVCNCPRGKTKERAIFVLLTLYFLLLFFFSCILFYFILFVPFCVLCFSFLQFFFRYCCVCVYVCVCRCQCYSQLLFCCSWQMLLLFSTMREHNNFVVTTHNDRLYSVYLALIHI